MTWKCEILFRQCTSFCIYFIIQAFVFSVISEVSILCFFLPLILRTYPQLYYCSLSVALNGFHVHGCSQIHSFSFCGTFICFILL